MKKLLAMLSICMFAVFFMVKPVSAEPTGLYPDLDYKTPVTISDKTIMQNNTSFFEMQGKEKIKLFSIKDCNANAKYYNGITYYDGKIYFVITLKNSTNRLLYSYDVANGQRKLIKTLSGKPMVGFNYGYFADNKFYYNVAASYTKSGKAKTRKIKCIDLTTGKSTVFKKDYAVADESLTITRVTMLDSEVYQRSDRYVVWQKASGRYYLYDVKTKKGMLLPKAGIFEGLEKDQFYAGDLTDYKGTIFCTMMEGKQLKGTVTTSLYKIDFDKKTTKKLKTLKGIYDIDRATSKYIYLINDSLEEVKVKY